MHLYVLGFLASTKKRLSVLNWSKLNLEWIFALIVILSLLHLYCRYFHQVLPMNNRDQSGLGPRCGRSSQWTVYARASNRWGTSLCYCSYSICWLQPRCIVLYWGWDWEITAKLLLITINLTCSHVLKAFIYMIFTLCSK